MHLTVQRRRPARIIIDKSRILFSFPEKRYVEKAPGAGPRSNVVPSPVPDEKRLTKTSEKKSVDNAPLLVYTAQVTAPWSSG